MWMLLTAALAAPPTVAVDVEWRAMGYANHVSHGPWFALSLGVLEDRFRIGLSGFARPGPINPTTFELSPSETYNGQDTLALRSDGGGMGLVLAPAIPTRHVRIDFPMTVGFGGFGFYLVGDDRETPDGRLPSAWEDELMDGRDSSFGIFVEGGVRASFTVSDVAQPYIAFRWTTIVGYDAFLATDYGGPALAVGLTVGKLRRDVPSDP
jgi:hypothetical protein